MAHNNRLSRLEAKRWAESLADVEYERADNDPPTDSPTPASPPWPTGLDVEYLDELVEHGRR